MRQDFAEAKKKQKRRRKKKENDNRTYVNMATFLVVMVVYCKYLVFWKLKKQKGMMITANASRYK